MTAERCNTEYTIVTMRFNYPDTWCVVQNLETEEQVDMRITELAQDSEILKHLCQGSLEALLCQLEQEQYSKMQ